MILKNAKTVFVGDDPFNIPNSTLTIWTIKLEVDGQRDTYKTMSEKIAEEGWSGDVELYTNKSGKDYIRQAPKEDTFTPGTGKTWQPKDDKNITLGLVFKTFCSIEGLLPNQPAHWAYIEKATRKLIEIGDSLKPVEKTFSEEEKPNKVEQPVDKWGNADDIDTDAPINLNDIPF